MSVSTSIDLNLPSVPNTTDPEVFEELLRIYNAIRSLAVKVDEYTLEGNLGVDAELTAAQTAAQLQSFKRELQQLSESLIPEIINWGHPGAIGATVPNTGKFTELTTTKFGVGNAVASSPVALPAAATDPASTQALANALRSLAITFGLGT